MMEFSISLKYKDGVLIQLLTRGDGYKGDDVTLNVKTIKSIPLKLRGDYPEEFEIRGEIFIPISKFNTLNNDRIKNDLVPFANPRKCFLRSLKLLDPSEVSKRPLDCFLYYLLGENIPTNIILTNLQLPKNWGLKFQMKLKDLMILVVLYLLSKNGKKKDNYCLLKLMELL